MRDDKGHTPQPGDLIEIKRSRIYQHWALYVGDGYVIHVTDVGPRDVFMSVGSCSNSSGKAMVKKELLREVARNDKWLVNNKYDDSHTPLPVEEIIQNAESLIGIEISYNLFKENCEHFVTLLRYDNKFSDQVKTAANLGICILSVIATSWAIFSAKNRVRRNRAMPAEVVQNVERKILDAPTEEVASLMTEILDTLSQIHVRNI